MSRRSEAELWDTKAVIRIVRAHSGYTLTRRQLQAWDKDGIARADEQGPRRARLYGFSTIRQLCIMGKLLKARLPGQRLRAALQNINRAKDTIGESWDKLRLVTDGNSVFVVDGDRAINALGGQLVSLILLGDLERKAKEVCDRMKDAEKVRTSRPTTAPKRSLTI